MIVGSLVLILSAAGLLAGGLILGNNWMLGSSIVASLLAAVLLYLGAKQSVSAREEARLRDEEHDDWDEDLQADTAERDEGYFDGQPDRGGYAEQVHHAEPIERAPTERVPLQRDLGAPSGAAAGTEPVTFGGQHAADRAYYDRAEQATGEFSVAGADFGRTEPAPPDAQLPPVEQPEFEPPPERVGPPPVEGAATATTPTVPAEVSAEMPTPPLGTPPLPDPDVLVGGGLDSDDPKDEPPIQRRTAQVAALVSRMDNDVFVIDGRPRYHLAGCVHLLGREHEPVPVDEAVELGFTPCSLCEPDTILTGGMATKARR
ncbi:MAG: hypothetical protein ACRDTM_09410 [Micromonosporaceae bacterium]